ncbi:MAG: O-antigen ligase family protein [Candidatus Rokubacteria bacterium]|nr:O-antigen ligase family protein [Candidatus Rokubacteria bacterium]
MDGDAVAHEPPPVAGALLSLARPLGFFALAGLFAVVLLTIGAIVWQSVPLALAVVASLLVGFAVLGWLDAAVALVALVVALPLVSVEVGFGDVERTVSGDKVVLVVLVATWLWRLPRARLAELGRLSPVRWWGVLIGVVVLSAIRNGLTPLQLWGVVGQVVYAGVFLVALDTFRDRSALRSTLGAAVVTAGIVSVLGVAEQAVWRSGHVLRLYFKAGTLTNALYGGATNFGSTIGHPNFFAAYVVLLLPVAAVLACVASRPARAALAAAATVAGAVALLAVRSLGAGIGLGAAVLSSTFLASRTGRARTAVIAAACGIALVLGVAAVRTRGFTGSTSVGVRAYVHVIGVAAIAERPWLGFGQRGFARQSNRLEIKSFGSRMLFLHKAHESISSHDSFLQVAVERGLIGLVAFVGLLGSILRKTIAGVLRPGGDSPPWLLLGMAAGLVAFVLQSFTEALFDYSKVASIFWIVAAAGVRLASPAGREAERG